MIGGGVKPPSFISTAHCKTRLAKQLESLPAEKAMTQTCPRSMMDLIRRRALSSGDSSESGIELASMVCAVARSSTNRSKVSIEVSKKRDLSPVGASPAWVENVSQG